MKLPVNWLKDFVKLPLKIEKLSDILTFSGTEVEKIEVKGDNLKNIVVGEIITIVKHTNADKLKLCKVRVKKGKVLKIVCGANNVKVGQKVPVALPGAELPDGTKIEKTKIRGLDSEGMLMAEDELGIGDDHAGIYILGDKAKIGQSIRLALGLSEPVLDLALTPNRADCFSVLGIAREVAAVSKRKLNFEPEKIKIKEKGNEINKWLTIKVNEKNLCPKYTARIIEEVEVGDSPEQIKNRLRAAGIRPVNNIVDATNYVMLELGQPLHAFDYDKLSGKKKSIIVRKAKKDEKLKTLDGKERELETNMLVIADGQGAIALAGVMGGEKTEICKKTTRVILESAVFKPLSVRKTAQKLALRSESSNRFEKGLDYNMTEIALDRAASLIAKLTGGKIVKGKFKTTHELKNLRPTITLSLDLLKTYLNTKPPISRLKQIFTSLGFEFIEAKEGKLKLKVPSWRLDVRTEEDLIEEVARLYDYNKLKPTFLKGILKPVELPKELYWQNKIKDLLVSADMIEVYNYSNYSENLAKNFGLNPEKHYRVTNPLNPEQEYLRQSLIPMMLKNVALNSDYSEDLAIFEVGNVFLSGHDLPKEEKMVAGVFAGEEAYYEAKAALDLLLSNVLNM